MNRTKNVTIELLRFYFMLLICLFHYRQFTLGMQKGYLAVEFFFLLSGFLLYHSYKRNLNMPVLRFCRHRFTRFQNGWTFFCATLITYCLNTVWQIWKVSEIDVIGSIWSFITEAFLLKGFGLFGIPVNVPCWYVSTLFIVSVFVFSILKYGDRFPVFAFLGFTSWVSYAIILHRGDLEDVLWEYEWVVYLPLLRAYAGVALGTVLAKIVDENMLWICNKQRLFLFLSIISFLLVNIALFSNVDLNQIRYVDGVFIILFVFTLLGSILMKDVFSRRVSAIINSFGGITYEMLLLHLPCLYIIHFAQKLIVAAPTVWLALYLGFVVLSSYCLHMISNLRVILKPKFRLVISGKA